MNIGSFKRYLRGDGIEHSVPKGLPFGMANRATVMDEQMDKSVAKSFLKVSLAEHDARFHKDGYKEGDVCNFREALKRGDDADAIKAAENEEKTKVGLVEYKEDPKTGKQQIVGIVEVPNQGLGGEMES